MGQVDQTRESVRLHVHRRDQIEAQQGQVGQVVRCQSFPGEMAVHEAESPETNGGGAEGRQVGDEDFPGRADDDVGDLSPAGNQQADLAIDFMRYFGQLSGQVMGQDLSRRDPATVELFDPPKLLRFQTAGMAVYLLNRKPLKRLSV